MESYQTMYERQLVFKNRFRAASKGSSRPTICSMDWYQHREEFDELMALSSSDLIRVFGRKRDKWEMLMNMKPSGMRKINTLKWSTESCMRMAVACGDGYRATIDFMDFKGQGFKRVKRFEVPQAGNISALSWSHCGKYLVATTSRCPRHPEPHMFVIKRQGKNRYIEKTIYCGYQSEFCSVFHPTSTMILTASARSTNILVWSEDVKTFDWTTLFKISSGGGIMDMCMSYDGNHLAAIVGKHLMIWKYCCVDEHGDSCYPKLEKIEYENDEVIKRKKSVSLSKHCENIISMSWSRSCEHKLLTGSSLGTMCVHAQKIRLETPFEEFYFRWSYVHAQNKDGPSQSMLALAGNDGVVTVWELMEHSFQDLHIRNYCKEINYFYPGRRSTAGPEVEHPDVASITSITLDGSDTSSRGEDASDGDEVDDVQVDEQDISTGTRSKVRRVLLKQEDVAKMLSDVFDGIQDALEKLDALQVITGAHEEKLYELADDSKEAKQNQEDIEELAEEVMQKLAEMKAGLASVGLGLGKLEEAVKQQAEALAALQVVQKPVEQEQAPKFQEVLLNQKADIFTRQNEMEKSFTSQCHKLGTMFLRKQNLLEQILIQKTNELEQQMQVRLNLMEEMNATKHNEITQRIDTVVGLLQKLCNTSP